MTKAHILANNSDYWSGMTETVQYKDDYIYDGATFSFWCKRSDVGTGKEMYIYDNASPLENQYVDWASGYWSSFGFDENDKFFMYAVNANYGTHDHIVTSMKFSDPNAWYHIHLFINAEESVASNRFKLTVNGQLITEYDPAGIAAMSDQTSIPIAAGFWSSPSISGDSYYQAGYNIGIGGPCNTFGRSYNSTTNNKEFKGILSHFYYDSKEHAASNFGEVDSTTGIWKFKPYSPTWSEHGFYILKDNNGFTDQSGKSPDYINTVTITGSVTDTLDCPSNVFATFNPLLDVNAKPTLSNGNTTMAGAAISSAQFTGSTICVSTGKWYYEVKVTPNSSSPYVGVIDAQSTLRKDTSFFVNTASGSNDSGYAVNMSGDIYHNNVSTYATNIGSISSGDILGFAIDLDSAQRTCEIYKNGASQRSFNLAEPSSGAYMLGCCTVYNTASASANFGNGYFGTTAVSSAGTNASGIGIFEYDVPTGYTALSTKGLNL